MNLATKRDRCGERLVGRILEALVIVLGDQQRRHRMPASFFSLATSSATEATLTPALRPGGSTVLITSKRGATSTPRSEGVFSSIGFFFAFMMLGSEA